MAVTDPKQLSVSVVGPPSANIEYFQQVSVAVTIINKTLHSVLIEEIVLQFNGDAGAVLVSQPCGFEIAPDRAGEQYISVTPRPIYLQHTNVYEIMVWFRPIDGYPGERQREFHRGSYLIIEPPKRKIGRSFISVKQPEDLRLAKLLERLAIRGGLEPYIAKDNPAYGSDLWKRIEADLRGSQLAFVIWTAHTEWGTGVQKEIDICRDAGIICIPLIAEGLDIPPQFRGPFQEYCLFDPEHPHEAFQEAVISARRAIHPAT